MIVSLRLAYKTLSQKKFKVLGEIIHIPREITAKTYSRNGYMNTLTFISPVKNLLWRQTHDKFGFLRSFY